MDKKTTSQARWVYLLTWMIKINLCSWSKLLPWVGKTLRNIKANLRLREALPIMKLQATRKQRHRFRQIDCRALLIQVSLIKVLMVGIQLIEQVQIGKCKWWAFSIKNMQQQTIQRSLRFITTCRTHSKKILREALFLFKEARQIRLSSIILRMSLI